MKNLVESILTCSTVPTNWDQALNTFNDTFQITASCMFSLHEFREHRLNFAWSRFFRQNMTPEVYEMMETGGDVGDLAGYQYLCQNPAQTLYDELTMFRVNSYSDLPPSNVRDFTEGWGVKMRVATALNKSGPWIDGLFCQHLNNAEWKAFVADHRTDVILPIMANSVALGRTLQALKTRYHASLSMLDALGLAVFLVDQTGCVIEHNTEAQRILDLRDGLTMTPAKHLKLHDHDRTKELETMVNTANGLLRGEIKAEHNLLTALRPSGHYDYLISVRALSDSNAELEMGLKCAFVTVIDPARKDALSSDGITALGQLTQAESDIVNLLIQGFRPADVAKQRDTSPNTIKTQLKVISQKLRCSSQSDIIRAAAATHIPLEK